MQPVQRFPQAVPDDPRNTGNHLLDHSSDMLVTIFEYPDTPARRCSTSRPCAPPPAQGVQPSLTRDCRPLRRVVGLAQLPLGARRHGGDVDCTPAPARCFEHAVDEWPGDVENGSPRLTRRTASNRRSSACGNQHYSCDARVVDQNVDVGHCCSTRPASSWQEAWSATSAPVGREL